MPFYEYECPHCRYYAEVMQKIADAPLKKCPSCGKAGFKRLISAPVFRLKGSGWYETDFKSEKDGQRNLAGADKDDAKPATEAPKDGKAAEKTDGKGEGKGDAKAGAGATAPASDGAKSGSATAASAGAAPASAPRRAARSRPGKAAPAKAAPAKAAPTRRSGGASRAPARRK